jgi:hypothetical protein
VLPPHLACLLRWDISVTFFPTDPHYLCLLSSWDHRCKPQHPSLFHSTPLHSTPFHSIGMGCRIQVYWGLPLNSLLPRGWTICPNTVWFLPPIWQSLIYNCSWTKKHDIWAHLVTSQGLSSLCHPPHGHQRVVFTHKANQSFCLMLSAPPWGKQQNLFLFFCWDWSLNLRALPLQSRHSTTWAIAPIYFALVILEIGGGVLWNYFPGLALNYNLPNLSLPTSWDYSPVLS